MSEIHKLASDVIDKIAAGEVVERPAHLLKELLENSLDAGADSIEIDVDEGGKSISVLDNGRGVEREDLPQVFARHATSKISESDDLWKLSTFGFRGEALASISSVSHLDFVSRRQGEEQGYHLDCHFGEIGEIRPRSTQVGTHVVVKDLFRNIPARLKFLKSDAAEVSQIKNVIKALALQYPDVQWKFKNKGQLVFFWPNEDRLIERARKVLETESLFENELEFESFKAKVVFSDPSNVVKVSRQIWIFVQNRWVQDKGIQAAVMEAYRSLLMHGQFPICYVSLQCPPDEVDVNIHPTKSQVKFVDPKKAFRAVHYCLREAIEKAPWQKRTLKSESPIARATPQNSSFRDQEIERVQFQQKFYRFSEGPNPGISMGELIQASDRQVLTPTSQQIPTFLPEEPSGSYWSRLQVIGQVDLTYIVAQAEDRMVLIDQHAAHERVAFERLMKAWKDGHVEVQSFLFPLTIDLEEAEVEALLSQKPELEGLGIAIEQEGPASIAISSHPSFVQERGLVEALKKLAQEILERGGSFAIETSIADLFATMACHSVIRAGQAMSRDEMVQLLKDMDEFPLSGFCPHGRNVAIEFSFEKMEKDFGRRA